LEAGVKFFAALISLLVAQASFAAELKIPAQIVSINMCTDQLLLDLAKPSQIVGLSPFARDQNLSWNAAKARDFPVLSGTAEEIITIKPDLVVTDLYTKRTTREFIRAKNFRLEEFPTVLSFKESRAQILRFGEITGAVERAKERVIELDQALAELKKVARDSQLSVLPLSRRGWVTGSQSLINELLSEAGLRNAAEDMGIRNGGFVRLESIITLKPDALLMTKEFGEAEDQGAALLLHPSLEKIFPRDRRIILPEKLTICGGPMLVEAMRLLATQLSQIKPRD
jgi:iron complex transport system substrate-binding protein